MIPIETWYLLYVYLLQKPSPHSTDRKKLKKKIQNIRRHLSTRIQWLRMVETPLDPTANVKETKGNVVLDRITFTKTLRIISNASQSIPLYAPRVADWLLTSTRVSSFLLFLNFFVNRHYARTIREKKRVSLTSWRVSNPGDLLPVYLCISKRRRIRTRISHDEKPTRVLHNTVPTLPVSINLIWGQPTKVGLMPSTIYTRHI